jgi:hypothetical protein
VILVLKWRYGRDLPRPMYGAEQEADDRSTEPQ